MDMTKSSSFVRFLVRNDEVEIPYFSKISAIKNEGPTFISTAWLEEVVYDKWVKP